MNKIIPLQEMIEEIKKHYNLNDTLLALNLKVTPQTVKGWKDGNIPREKTYNKILEIYNNIINLEEQTKEVAEVTEKKPYEISYPNDGEKIYYISHFPRRIKGWAKEQQGDWQPDWKDKTVSKYFIFSDIMKKLNIGSVCTLNYLRKLPHFKSKEIAQACIDEFEDEILEVFC